VIVFQDRDGASERRDGLGRRSTALRLEDQAAILERHSQASGEPRIFVQGQNAKQRDPRVVRTKREGDLCGASESNQRVGPIQPARREAIPEDRDLVNREAAAQFEGAIEADQRLGDGVRLSVTQQADAF
jgi:hypothetical protein